MAAGMRRGYIPASRPTYAPPHPSSMPTSVDTAGVGAAAPALPHERTLFGHPRGLWLLFVVEMWERFSYYGMRALLVLYLVNEVGWTDAGASRLYGWYTGLVYLTPVIGGWLADRFVGTRRSLVVGGVTIAAGHFALAVQGTAFFYAGLALIIVGTGFFKPNVSTMVGQLYREGDPRRDAGFTIFYMGINTGAFIAPLLTALLAQQVGWHYGFGAAGVGMLLGLVIYLAARDRLLPGIGLAPEREIEREARAVKREPLTREERDRIWVIGITVFFVIFFWAAYEQAGASMNLFADRNTDLNPGAGALDGIEAVLTVLTLGLWRPDLSQLPAAWFQSVNPLVVILFAPVFAWLWTRLRGAGLEPSTPVKMALGLMLLAGGFVVMVFAGSRASAGMLVSPLWLVAAYTLHSWGELCLSPVGLSLVSKLAPVRLAAMLMGSWFIANFAAGLLAGYLSSLMGRFDSLAGFFGMFVAMSAAAGLIFLALSPLLKRMMHGRG